MSTTFNVNDLNPENVKIMQEFFGLYNRLTEACFNDCFNDFTNLAMTEKEKTCGLNCVEKMIKVNQRISTRFQEQQTQMQPPSMQN